jgi:hypothetical protein
MQRGRALTVLAVAALALACAGSALAAGHSQRISGRVVSINIARHTLRLRVAHARKARVADASGGSQSAGPGPVVVVGFGNATVTGPDGAVAVGDEVTVTTGGASGQTDVATSIQVIGQPNGGSAGKGAAVPGEVTAVDAAHDQITLAVTATDGQGQAQASSVIVTVGPSAILAVGDTNGDGAVTLADVSVGDHVVVFTDDATADPMTAIGILDASHGGANHEDGAGGSDDGGGSSDTPPSDPTTPSDPAPPSNPTTSTMRFGGTVTDVRGDGLTVEVTSGGSLSGQSVIVAITDTTSFATPTGRGVGLANLANIALGDPVEIFTASESTTPVVALGVVDDSAATGSKSGEA